MKIAIGSDHAGFGLKSQIISYLISRGEVVEDVGCYSPEPCDYPDFANLVCEHILEKRAEIGILICGTGIGMSICANRNVGVRAAICFNEYMAQKAKMHNDANVLVLGAKMLEPEAALSIVDSFLISKFEGGRHTVRLKKFN